MQDNGVAPARRGASRAPPPITASLHYAIGHCFGGEVCFAFKLCVCVFFFAAIYTFINNLPGPIHVLHLVFKHKIATISYHSNASTS